MFSRFTSWKVSLETYQIGLGMEGNEVLHVGHCRSGELRETVVVES